jgi:hypothetical protein
MTDYREEFAAQEGRGQAMASLLNAIWTPLLALDLPPLVSVAENLQKMIDIFQQALAF